MTVSHVPVLCANFDLYWSVDETDLSLMCTLQSVTQIPFSFTQTLYVHVDK